MGDCNQLAVMGEAKKMIDEFFQPCFYFIPVAFAEKMDVSHKNKAIVTKWHHPDQVFYGMTDHHVVITLP